MIICIIERLEGYVPNTIYHQGVELIVVGLLFTYLLIFKVLHLQHGRDLNSRSQDEESHALRTEPVGWDFYFLSFYIH